MQSNSHPISPLLEGSRLSPEATLTPLPLLLGGARLSPEVIFISPFSLLNERTTSVIILLHIDFDFAQQYNCGSRASLKQTER